ncbi:hypothetical protein CEXT_6641 [Caerostris extrusa]|uniref:Uncharacterized protein n=1 Tax=Caerostris extrusa TaxID=172846 RepID=A0AAV4RLB5_CAEEX|nr:hypothetical protein CEXT_6641 [Caerostris extrusa]
MISTSTSFTSNSLYHSPPYEIEEEHVLHSVTTSIELSLYTKEIEEEHLLHSLATIFRRHTEIEEEARHSLAFKGRVVTGVAEVHPN